MQTQRRMRLERCVVITIHDVCGSGASARRGGAHVEAVDDMLRDRVEVELDGLDLNLAVDGNGGVEERCADAVTACAHSWQVAFEAVPLVLHAGVADLDSMRDGCLQLVCCH